MDEALLGVKDGALAADPALKGLDSSQRAAALSAPVSYTHLRAHETVLDLVCRLLLEKKTQQANEKLSKMYCDNNTETKNGR